jgi:4-hydroxy-3-methylbut-2-enyl diphosphate reductase
MTDLFHDRDVQDARRQGGTVPLGGGRVLLLPRIGGFCRGVLVALQRLESVLARTERPVWLLGEIIHNDTVNAHFRERDVHILPEAEIERVFERADPADTFVIPAFGLERDFEKRLRAFAPQVEDTTCDCVQSVWTFVASQAACGHTILLHGKPSHPETRATLSRALGPDNAAVLVPSLDHARRFAAAIRSGSLADYPADLIRHPDRLDLHRLAVANQTTMLFSETRELEAIIAAAVRETGGELVPASTVCRATQARQDAAGEMCAAGVDLVLVLGGFSSSNTAQLLRLAQTYAPAYFVGTASALSPDRIRHYDPASGTVVETTDWLPPPGGRIALLAGASCPPGDIGDAIRVLRQIT